MFSRILYDLFCIEYNRLPRLSIQFNSIRMETVISPHLRQIAPVNPRDYYAAVLCAPQFMYQYRSIGGKLLNLIYYCG